MRKARLKNFSDADLEALAKRFRALGEPSRLRLICALLDGERNVSELVDHTGLSQPNVSRHLGVLESVQVIARRKAGACVLYRICDDSLIRACELACQKGGG